MAKQRAHARLLAFPVEQSPAGGRLDALDVRGSDLLVDYHELQLTAPPALFEREGGPWERVQGLYRPRRLRFAGVQIIHGRKLDVCLEDLPPEHPSRALTSALAWRSPAGQHYYLFGTRVPAHPSLLLVARRCAAEERAGPTRPVTLARDWSPPPLSPARLVPNPRRLYERYGGDPVAVELDGRVRRWRLFVGGVDVQGEQRPDVHAVLNVGGEASRWTAAAPPHPADRWDHKGEGPAGMSPGEIAAEARWVIERLRAGQRVLVHCTAGMNRSATICCAVLILLEGLSAEAALERVRERHPWARPDSRHWLALRWLAHTAGPLARK